MVVDSAGSVDDSEAELAIVAVSALVVPTVDCEISVPEEVSEVSSRVFVEIGVVLSGD